MVELFIDTANLEEIKEIISWGIVEGCTTNPRIVSEEKGINFEEHMKKILRIVNSPVSIEVTTNDTEEMIKEAEMYNSWGNNVVIKIPMNIPGLKAVKILKEKGIKTNVTACMSTKQAVIAAKAGATYVSLFWARIEDMGYDAERVVKDSAKIFKDGNFDSKIIIGSFRQISHINRALLTGADILTISPSLLKQMVWNPRTDSTIDEFLEFWEKFKREDKSTEIV